MCIYSRHVSYTLCREEGLALFPRLISFVREKEPGYEAKEGSGHTATMELSLRQKLDVANQIRTCRRSHPLPWSTITSSVKQMSASYYLTPVFSNCIPRR